MLADHKFAFATYMVADRSSRFKGAYCSVYEKEDCAELFGVEMDVMSDTLPEMARKVIKAASKA